MNGPDRQITATVVAMHGSSTRITAVRMSVTAAIIGVATIGKPKPSAPCTSPAKASTSATQINIASVRFSKPGKGISA